MVIAPPISHISHLYCQILEMALNLAGDALSLTKIHILKPCFLTFILLGVRSFYKIAPCCPSSCQLRPGPCNSMLRRAANVRSWLFDLSGSSVKAKADYMTRSEQRTMCERKERKQLLSRPFCCVLGKTADYSRKPQNAICSPHIPHDFQPPYFFFSKCCVSEEFEGMHNDKKNHGYSHICISCSLQVSGTEKGLGLPKA